jgi:hypothetical protein
MSLSTPSLTTPSATCADAVPQQRTPAANAKPKIRFTSFSLCVGAEILQAKSPQRPTKSGLASPQIVGMRTFVTARPGFEIARPRVAQTRHVNEKDQKMLGMAAYLSAATPAIGLFFG